MPTSKDSGQYLHGSDQNLKSNWAFQPSYSSSSSRESFDLHSITNSVAPLMGGRKESWRMYLAAASALGGAVAVGCVLAFTNLSIQENRFVSAFFDVTDTTITSTTTSTINSTTYSTLKSSMTRTAAVGFLLGAAISFLVTQKCGRKPSLVFAGLPVALGWCLTLISKSQAELVAATLFANLGAGFLAAAIPVYVVEISTPSRRGQLGAFYAVAISLGGLWIQVGAFLSACNKDLCHVTLNGSHVFSDDSHVLPNSDHVTLDSIHVTPDSVHVTPDGAHVVVALCLLPVILSALGMVFSSETPRWLMIEFGRPDARTQKAVRQLRNADSDVAVELAELEAAAKDVYHNWGFVLHQQIRSSYLGRPVLLSLSIIVFGHVMGGGVMPRLATKSLEEFLPNLDSILDKICISGVQLVAMATGVFLVPNVGRRTLLIASALGAAVCLAVHAVYEQKEERRSNPNKDWFSLVFSILYLAAYSLGWAILPIVSITELAPNVFRGLFLSVTAFGNYLINYLVSEHFLELFKNFENESILQKIYFSRTLWFFAAASLSAAFFVYSCLPETEGVDLYEIQQEMSGEPILISKSTANPVGEALQMTETSNLKCRPESFRSYKSYQSADSDMYPCRNGFQ